MKKINLIYTLIASTLLLTNCKKNEITQEKLPNNNLEKQASSMDNKLDLLGYGYDATGRYANIESSRLQVIDAEKFYNLDRSHVGIIAGVEDFFEYKFANNAREYSDSLSVKATGGFSAFGLFKAEINTSFGNSEAFKGSYSLANATKYIVQKRLNFSTSIQNLRDNYLSASFVNDLNRLSAQEIVSYYGTHVCTNIVLGAKFSFSYRTETSSSKKRESLAAGLAVNGLAKVWSATADFTYNASDAKANYNQQVNYRSVGGDGTQGLIGEISLDYSTPTKISINQWQSTCKPQNAILIDFGNGGLVPLYEFVSNPTKKAQIKTYIEQYLAANRTEISLNKIPIYRYYSANMVDHIYDPQPNVISYDNTWVKEKIAFYGYNYPAPNTVAVYKYFIPSMNDHVYYTDPYIQYRDSNVKNEGIIFYVPTQNLPGTKPVYKYYSDSMKDHIFELDPNINQVDKTWIREDIVFNAFPAP
ncbi:MAC/perforin domain-containing protein [Sphingobacterium spiritivorum]|nr:MAC/perforin domain-containing protein [Sphingobacterium spiritivorum]QQS96122.1 hypothetical protein I6J03_22600 [Sphingobacterium spiritivorum]